MTTAPTPTDYLKYASARLQHCTEWALDSIGGSDANEGDVLETELDYIHDAITEVAGIAAQFGDPMTYSDGRRVKSYADIEFGVGTSVVWHPNPDQDTAKPWRGNLRPETDDEDAPSPGIYQVSYDAHAQQIHVRVIRLVNEDEPQ